MKVMVSLGVSVVLIGLLSGSVGWGHAAGTSHKTGKNGTVVSQGDVLLRASEARAAFGVDGTGVRVGVIADGANTLATAQASGDLPATLSVFQACDPGTADTSCHTGTAMLEVVHDMAPGAELAVCSATTRADMMSCVNTLSSTFGAEVIVDGLAGLADGKSVGTLFAEPYFADGPFAQAVAAAVASGVSYIAAAGDFADKHYEADFEPFLVPTLTRTIEFHDFGVTAGGASDATMDLQLAGSGTLEAFLQWNDDFGASRNNYDLILANETETLEIALGERTQDGDDDPIETLTYTNPSASPVIVKIRVEKFRGVDRRIELFVRGDVEILEYGIPAGSVFGPAAGPGTLAVAAVNAEDPGTDTVQALSSQGPSRIFFPTDSERQKPDVTAVDNVAITAASGVGPTFTGTAAAAAHVAGIVALVRSAAPGFEAEQVGATVQASARDIEAPGFDSLSGAGLIDALAALQMATGMEPPALGVLENPQPGGAASGAGVIFGWVCSAEQVDIEIDGVVFQAAYGTSRGDTLQECGDTDNGFGLLINWNLVGNGEHTVRALADGVAFGTALVSVTTLGTEFLTDAEGNFTLGDFPQTGDSVEIAWQQALQNFVIVGATGSGGGSNGSPPAVLENPQAGAFASGAGIVSGWVCNAEQVEIKIDGVVFQAAYGTSRADTFGACGDTNNGFGLLVNWNLFGNGVHTLRALADGDEFANASFVVTTLGAEFLTGASGTFTLDDFPQPGESIDVEWQEPLQNFVIVGMQ